MRDRGIYYGWSHIYGHKPKPGDRAKLLAYEEVVNAGSDHLKGSTIGLVNFAPDLQQLSIQLTVNMLNHRNPYTGMRYADDPALSFIELQNEDNLFFATAHNWVMACPTYKKLFCQQFSKWLRDKYGTHDKLTAVWGRAALNAWPQYQVDEHLDKQNIYPLAHHGHLGAKNMENPLLRKRLLDTALFLYQTQNAFYQKYINAIRATGYKGPIVASCWQAGNGVAHYYNLHTDYLAGIIDRHNYYGGGEGGHRLAAGNVTNVPMVSNPGSGLLSTGMQAVADRPFAFSEWMSMAPNEWTAESAPIVAIYGMGLQGWDASYLYASNEAGFTPVLQAPRHGVYNADSPLHMGLFPILARMIYRQDVQEGGIISTRNVHIPSLAEGKLGFKEEVKQDQDKKTFSGLVPQEALAAGKVIVKFTEKFEETEKADISAYLDSANHKVSSNTGQLTWHFKNDGFFTVNTPATKGVVGFSGGITHQLGEVSIQVQSPFALVFVSSLDKSLSIHSAKRLLITTIARARNTGMSYNSDGTKLLATGETPLLLEAVQASLSVRREGIPTVYVLDHIGKRTGEQIKLTNNTLNLDGRRYKTMYYEIEYK